MESCERFLQEMGFIKTNKAHNWFGKKYEGYCKSVEYLRLLLQNLFGGDGHDEERINNQFNGKLYIENKEQ